MSGFRNTGAPHDEGQHLQDVFPTARAHGGPGRFALDPAARLDEHSALATADAAERLFAQWSRYWDLDRPVLIEKSPPNLIRTRFLQELYPDARFLVIVRHPAITALATRKLSTNRLMRRLHRAPALPGILDHWFAAHRALASDLPHLRRRRVIRWEELTAAPGQVLAEVSSFLGVSPDVPAPALDPRVDGAYRAEWQALLSADNRPGESLRRAVSSHAADAATFGYDLADPAVLEPLRLS